MHKEKYDLKLRNIFLQVFFRPGKFAEFDQMLRSDPENLRRLVAKVKKWILCSYWKKGQWCALSVIKLKNKIIYRREALIVIQKSVRMHLARRRHAPRYKGILRLKKLQAQIEEIGVMASKLKVSSSSVFSFPIHGVFGLSDNWDFRSGAQSYS